jgi:phosphatidylserine/phosphatidylglycerophosphate/cardiolipin synthase-like enzyme
VVRGAAVQLGDDAGSRVKRGDLRDDAAAGDAPVAAVVAVFNADYAHTSITPSDGDDLVWSPTDSQSHLLALIDGAQHSLDIEQEEFSDTTLVNAVVADENRGVTVRVVVEDPSDYTSELDEITAAGGKVTGYSSSTGFYIHAKDGHRRLRRVDRGGVRRLGELLKQLTERQPGTGNDHQRLRRDERSRDRVQRGLHRVEHRQGRHLQPRHPDHRDRRLGLPADAGRGHLHRFPVL